MESLPSCNSTAAAGGALAAIRTSSSAVTLLIAAEVRITLLHPRPGRCSEESWQWSGSMSETIEAWNPEAAQDNDVAASPVCASLSGDHRRCFGSMPDGDSLREYL